MSLRSPDDRRMLTRRSLMAVARAAALILASSALVATDWSLPSSKALRISSSYASVFGIRLTLAQVVSRRLAARDDGFEEEVILLLDERNQKDVVVRSHDENSLPRILRRIRVGQDVEQAARVDGHHNALERNTALSFERFVLLRAPPERLHARILPCCVPFVTTPGIESGRLPPPTWSRWSRSCSGDPCLEESAAIRTCPQGLAPAPDSVQSKHLLFHGRRWPGTHPGGQRSVANGRYDKQAP